MIDHQTRFLLQELLAEYAHCLDAGEFERWPAYFTESGRYRITSEFNYGRGLPAGIMQADNQRMMTDRIAALRDANIYEPQSYRHILSGSRITGEDPGLVSLETNFLVVRTMHSGDQMLFASGRYIDDVVAKEGNWYFQTKIVVLDSDKIDTLLVIPL